MPLDGITPAGAGKTPFVSGCCNPYRDHPRRCGENFPADSPVKPCTGSPPQVRGKPGYTDEAKKPLGITPAGAGKTPLLY